jgi:hypothetical protein
VRAAQWPGIRSLQPQSVDAIACAEDADILPLEKLGYLLAISVIEDLVGVIHHGSPA